MKDESNTEKREVNLWYCDGCRMVHLSAAGVTINFNKEEFERFSDAVVELQCREMFNPEQLTAFLGMDENVTDITLVTSSVQ